MDLSKKVERLIYGHIEDVGNVFPLISDLKGFTVVSFAATDIAGNINIR